MSNKLEKIKVTAKTLEQALEKAAVVLGIEQEAVHYAVVSQTSGGFFSFIGKRIEISAWDSRHFSEEQSCLGRFENMDPRQKPVTTDAPELSQVEIDVLSEELRLFCAGICTRMVGEDVSVTAVVEGDRLVLDAENSFLSQQLNKNAKLAESIEHVLRKMPRHLKRELPFRVFFDVDGHRRKREKDLRDMAFDLSDKVHQNKRPIVLNYKNSYDRKIIHTALDKDSRVYTKSIGSGGNRKLMILPVKKKMDVSQTQSMPAT